MKRAVTFTFSEAAWRRIIARWGSASEWKAWAKQQTFDVLDDGTHMDRY